MKGISAESFSLRVTRRVRARYLNARLDYLGVPSFVIMCSPVRDLQFHHQRVLVPEAPFHLIKPVACPLRQLEVIVPQHLCEDQPHLGICQIPTDALSEGQPRIARTTKYCTCLHYEFPCRRAETLPCCHS